MNQEEKKKLADEVRGFAALLNESIARAIKEGGLDVKVSDYNSDMHEAGKGQVLIPKVDVKIMELI